MNNPYSFSIFSFSYLRLSLLPQKDAHMFFFPFLCSGIPDLALGILKKLICVCFHDVLQPAVYKFVSGMI